MSYSPTLGRWLERDPIGYIDGLNLYQYVRGNPTGYVDPSGLIQEDPNRSGYPARGLGSRRAV